MNINYPAEYEIGDIVFTCIGAALFGQVSAASNCWSNHVGIIIGHNGEDFLVAESRVPLSTITTPVSCMAPTGAANTGSTTFLPKKS